MKKQEKANTSVLDIDKYCLDEEWVDQPAIYAKYARKLANARKDLDEAKATYDVIKASVSQQVYTAPEKFNIQKVTENKVQCVVTLQKECRDAHQAVIDSKHAVDIMTAMVTALDHRKSALERLVTLHGQDYFSSPQVAPEHSEDMNTAKTKATRRKGNKTKGGRK